MFITYCWVIHIALEKSEPYAGKLARTVLRGRSHGNMALLPDIYQRIQNEKKHLIDDVIS